MTNCMTKCCACGPCKPRYKRLVDAIYPNTPDQGLVTPNMEKLLYYAMTHPEKLDRIGSYLVARLTRNLRRARTGYVRVSMAAMDKLLQSCPESNNLFVESFLKMVHTLLADNTDAELQIMATDSFVNFANRQEETPSYHRRYDFLISRFSEMCHGNKSDRSLSRRLRLAGLKGLRGVVRKAVGDDLQANIWDKRHMEKIVPSILYNMNDCSFDSSTTDQVDSDAGTDGGNGTGNEGGEQKGNPRLLADQCLRELVGKGSFGSMRSVLLPILRHFDLHQLWTPPPDFAVSCFRAVMYSIQSQYSYVIIQTLIGHLDERGVEGVEASTRIGIASVLSAVVPIAGTSMGPSVLDIFNSLLRHLRSSVEFQLTDNCPSVDKEKLYQETLINAMGDFANSLPDYQKVEIMLFTIGKIPALNEDAVKRSDGFLQHVLVKTLLQVAVKYRTGYLATVLTTNFLAPLLKLALVDDAKVRLLTQQILHTLLDRHDNLNSVQHLKYVEDVAELGLKVEKCSRADQMFMKKNVASIVYALYKSATSGGGVNSQANMDALLCTMSLLCLEVGFDELLIELYRLAFGLQAAALDANIKMTVQNRGRVHNLVAKYLNLSAQLMAIPSLSQHVHMVIKCRSERGHAMLDMSREGEDDGSGLTTTDNLCIEDDATLLFDKATLVDCLKACGKDVSRLSLPLLSKQTPDSLLLPNDQQQKRTADDSRSISIDMSADSSIVISQGRNVSRRNTVFSLGAFPLQQRPFDADDDEEEDATPLTVDSLRELVNNTNNNNYSEKLEAAERRKTEHLVSVFRNQPFEQLVQMTRECQMDLNASIRAVFERSRERHLSSQQPRPDTKSIFEIELPQMFVY